MIARPFTAIRLPCSPGRCDFRISKLPSVNGLHTAELPAEASGTTAGEFRECPTHFELNTQGKNREGEGRDPVTKGCPESWGQTRAKIVLFVFHFLLYFYADQTCVPCVGNHTDCVVHSGASKEPHYQFYLSLTLLDHKRNFFRHLILCKTRNQIPERLPKAYF